MTIRAGAVLWLLAIQFFVVQIVVASQWATPFSLKTRYISDLGNTVCGRYPNASSVVVCSPGHAVMNASFVLVGITMAAGAVLARRAFTSGARRALAVTLFVAAGVGVMMVGIYPENENITLHSIGAGVNFLAANTALILFGATLPRVPPRPVFRSVSIGFGLVGLVSTVLFVVGRDLGLGAGGIERCAAYTTTIWQIVAGLVLLPRRPAV